MIALPVYGSFSPSSKDLLALIPHVKAEPQEHHITLFSLSFLSFLSPFPLLILSSSPFSSLISHFCSFFLYLYLVFYLFYTSTPLFPQTSLFSPSCFLLLCFCFQVKLLLLFIHYFPSFWPFRPFFHLLYHLFFSFSATCSNLYPSFTFTHTGTQKFSNFSSILRPAHCNISHCTLLTLPLLTYLLVSLFSPIFLSFFCCLS